MLVDVPYALPSRPGGVHLSFLLTRVVDDQHDLPSMSGRKLVHQSHPDGPRCDFTPARGEGIHPC